MNGRVAQFIPPVDGGLAADVPAAPGETINATDVVLLSIIMRQVLLG